MKNRNTIGNRQLAIGKKSRKKISVPANLAYCQLLIACFLTACNSDYSPKPRGYFKIDLPQKKYQSFDRVGYPYSFEYPAYGEVIKDSLFFGELPENDYWINVDFPQFEGKIHLSYKKIEGNNFDSLVADAFNMSRKQHTYKATAIDDSFYTTLNNYGAAYFTLKGNTATGNQFFVTDSVNHFLRGALYFNATPNSDSIQPVNDFLRRDVEHLINTIKWK